MTLRTRTVRCCTLALGLPLLATWATAADAQVRFRDDFARGLGAWELHGKGTAFVHDSGDPAHGRVLVLRPNGDAYALVRGSGRWGPVRIEADVLFPDSADSYLGVVYNFRRAGRRTDFGLIYIKGNDSYLSVNPHRDFNVGRTLYEEYTTRLAGDAAIHVGRWQRFRVEIVGRAAHFYVGDMRVPQLVFDDLELDTGAVGLQPRSVGADVLVDNVVVTSIAGFSYAGPPRPAPASDAAYLLARWEAAGPFDRTDDEHGLAAHRRRWRAFATDARGAVVTGRLVDYHGPATVGYFRTVVTSPAARDAALVFSTADDLALWVNGRFHWFVPRARAAWYDARTNPQHAGTRIPVALRAGPNEIVVRVRGGSYASGGFFAHLDTLPAAR